MRSVDRAWPTSSAMAAAPSRRWSGMPTNEGEGYPRTARLHKSECREICSRCLAGAVADCAEILRRNRSLYLVHRGGIRDAEAFFTRILETNAQPFRGSVPLSKSGIGRWTPMAATAAGRTLTCDDGAKRLRNLLSGQIVLDFFRAP